VEKRATQSTFQPTFATDVSLPVGLALHGFASESLHCCRVCQEKTPSAERKERVAVMAHLDKLCNQVRFLTVLLRPASSNQL
jgi:hypothetical protein